MHVVKARRVPQTQGRLQQHDGKHVHAFQAFHSSHWPKLPEASSLASRHLHRQPVNQVWQSPRQQKRNQRTKQTCLAPNRAITTADRHEQASNQQTKYPPKQTGCQPSKQSTQHGQANSLSPKAQWLPSSRNPVNQPIKHTSNQSLRQPTVPTNQPN